MIYLRVILTLVYSWFIIDIYIFSVIFILFDIFMAGNLIIDELLKKVYVSDIKNATAHQYNERNRLSQKNTAISIINYLI